MLLTDYDQKYLDIVKSKILELSDGIPVEIFLFGSRAAGTAQQSSDMDVGFENINPGDFRKIYREFYLFWEESIVPQRVDLVNFQNVPEEFAQEAKKKRIIWKAD